MSFIAKLPQSCFESQINCLVDYETVKLVVAGLENLQCLTTLNHLHCSVFIILTETFQQDGSAYRNNG